jgi:hypothetical protein
MYVFAAGCPAVEHLAGTEDFQSGVRDLQGRLRASPGRGQALLWNIRPPSNFTVDMTTHVNIVFKPSGCPYTFGRFAEPEDIARYGPLARKLKAHGGTGDTGEYP